MPSPITIDVVLKKYIREYYNSLYGNPAAFPKKHPINSAITFYLCKPPVGYIQRPSSPDDLQILLLYNRDKNIIYNSYLTARSKVEIRSHLKDMFYLQFHRFIDRRVAKGLEIKESIWTFIRMHNMSPDAYDTLAKKVVRRLGEDYQLIQKKHVTLQAQMSARNFIPQNAENIKPVFFDKKDVTLAPQMSDSCFAVKVANGVPSSFSEKKHVTLAPQMSELEALENSLAERQQKIKDAIINLRDSSIRKKVKKIRHIGAANVVQLNLF